MALKVNTDAAFNWIYPGDPKAHHDKIVRERAPASGSWFLESEPFLEWCADKPKTPSRNIILGRAIRQYLIFIHPHATFSTNNTAGAGKTFLA
jgi:hypothetical protein